MNGKSDREKCRGDLMSGDSNLAARRGDPDEW